MSPAQAPVDSLAASRRWSSRLGGVALGCWTVLAGLAVAVPLLRGWADADLLLAIGGLVGLFAGPVSAGWWMARSRVQVMAAREAAVRPALTGGSGLFSGGPVSPSVLTEVADQRLQRVARWWQVVPVAVAGLVGIGLPVAWWLLGQWQVAGAWSLPVGVSLLVLAFPVMVLERAVLDDATLPESVRLARLSRLTVWLLVLLGTGSVLQSPAIGLGFAAYLAPVVVVVVALISLEFLVRALATPFLPVAPAESATALGDSALVALVATRTRGQPVIAAGLKERFGIDLGATWTWQVLRRAVPLVTAGIVLMAWLVSGLVVVRIGERAVEERFGSPAWVVQPGLHLTLPWPAGRWRVVESGRIHELVLAMGRDGKPAASGYGYGLFGGPAMALPMLAVEADPPPDTDRLWDKAHDADGLYLVPSASATGPGQSHQLLNSDIRIRWRFGGDDADARLALYATTDPEDRLRRDAGRLLTATFATRSLAGVIAQDRDALAQSLADALNRDLRQSAGIEILSVVVDAIHPPIAAAPSYHGVQAAEIASRAEVARARSDAAKAIAEAGQASAVRIAQAQGLSGELVSSATAEIARFHAESQAWSQYRDAVALERWLQTLARGVAKAPLTVIDHRLDAAGAPTIDLRRFAPDAP